MGIQIEQPPDGSPIVIDCQAVQSGQMMRCDRCMQAWAIKATHSPPCKRGQVIGPIVFLVSRERIEQVTGAPAFGMAYWAQGVILIRADLPPPVRRAIIAHECNHIERGDRGGFWRNEAPAWWAQLKAEPLGTLLAVLMSLHPRRLAWYARRIFVQGN